MEMVREKAREKVREKVREKEIDASVPRGATVPAPEGGRAVRFGVEETMACMV